MWEMIRSPIGITLLGHSLVHREHLKEGECSLLAPVTYLNQRSSFFENPAAVTGVFIAIGLVIGSLWWMFILIRRHRREAATAPSSKRKYAYDAPDLSPGEREGSFYDGSRWPQRFEEEMMDSVPEIQLRTPPSHRIDVSNCLSSAAVVNGTSRGTSSSGPILPVSQRLSLEEIGFSRMASPIFSSHLPFQSNPALSPVCASLIIAPPTQANSESRNYEFAPISEFYSPASASQVPLSRSVSANQPFPTKLATIYDAIEPPTPRASALQTPTSGRTSPATSDGDPFQFSGYLIPSPAASASSFRIQENLNNPFADADSPRIQSSPLPYVHKAQGAAKGAVLEYGDSPRRNRMLREKPEQPV